MCTRSKGRKGYSVVERKERERSKIIIAMLLFKTGEEVLVEIGLLLVILIIILVVRSRSSRRKRRE